MVSSHEKGKGLVLKNTSEALGIRLVFLPIHDRKKNENKINMAGARN
jgi:hypothetical protein